MKKTHQPIDEQQFLQAIASYNYKKVHALLNDHQSLKALDPTKAINPINSDTIAHNFNIRMIWHLLQPDNHNIKIILLTSYPTDLLTAITEHEHLACKILLDAYGHSQLAQISPQSTTTKQALQHAVQYGNTHALTLLLEYGADVNTANDKGYSLALLAVYLNQPQCLEIIINHVNYCMSGCYLIDHPELDIDHIMHTYGEPPNHTLWTPELLALATNNQPCLEILYTHKQQLLEHGPIKQTKGP
ncbi:ankyrin repeat domain-containing protein [Candidatus Synchoanobacter obligatus]|uniref:Ankyrin repeat domain-containing protein n=1 Tax=Candidatus Synchoanobacter obligatus TaxID=2919597 RepID=A0ABT1L4Z3_9GAMM|nr:ankyrin repeat domain-containing protein [Candidatus Synchoanobacter obligatus]MCP8351795.1 ankyrin repeat domain-containing protein [Candidatus Synchoanobacter obligatus]